MSPPNILFLLADQLRFDAVTDEYMPHLSSLARDGARFVRHYSSTPTCTPARAAILTGLSPWRHGMLGYGDVALRYKHELPAALQSKGYQTLVVGKDHFGWNSTADTGIAHGFENLSIYDGLGNGFPSGSEYDDYDMWFQKQCPGEDPLKSGGLSWNSWKGAPYEYAEWLHPTAWTGRVAVEQLRSVGKGAKPFFLKVSFHRPHSPYDPPMRLLNQTRAPSAPPAIPRTGWDARYKDCKAKGTEHQWCGNVDPADLDLTRRAYLASAAFVDEQIGIVLNVLREVGALETTFILFTSDHGDQQMDHYLWRKGYPYEGSSHVPLIIRWPEAMNTMTVSRNSTITAVTELRDVFPTFLDVVGKWDQSVQAAFDGRPLTWLLRAETPEPWREYIDLEHATFYLGSWNALTDGDVKYIFHADTMAEQLFNLTADPGEKVDLAASADDSYTEALLAKWRERLIDQFERENRGLGWVSGGHLVRRPIPCLYSPHFPEKSVMKLVCSAVSVASPMWIALLLIALSACLVSVATSICCYKRYRRRRKRAHPAVEIPSVTRTGMSSLSEAMILENNAR
eukprot:TRINITY_DN20271_c0_g2_i3.p1 TRINITY_DN20271_c0_g2~~TRINITY_DN20271_c0_g2_i3.p1  ORF type:complete len:568 (-),score=44.84 TRINITY_DN20271_c0_g2_i3:102-1805(-)